MCNRRRHRTGMHAAFMLFLVGSEVGRSSGVEFCFSSKSVDYLFHLGSFVHIISNGFSRLSCTILSWSSFPDHVSVAFSWDFIICTVFTFKDVFCSFFLLYAFITNFVVLTVICVWPQHICSDFKYCSCILPCQILPVLLESNFISCYVLKLAFLWTLHAGRRRREWTRVLLWTVSHLQQSK